LKEKEYILFYCGNISDDLSGVLKSMTKFSYKLDGRLRLANSNKANVQDKMGCNLNGEDEGDNLNKENNGNITKTNSTNSNIKNTPTTNTTNPKLLFINKYENGLYEYSDEFTKEKIDNWIINKTTTIINDLDSDSIVESIANKKPSVIFFYTAKQKQDDRVLPPYKEFYNLAKQFKV